MVLQGLKIGLEGDELERIMWEFDPSQNGRLSYAKLSNIVLRGDHFADVTPTDHQGQAQAGTEGDHSHKDESKEHKVALPFVSRESNLHEHKQTDHEDRNARDKFQACFGASARCRECGTLVSLARILCTTLIPRVGD